MKEIKLEIILEMSDELAEKLAKNNVKPRVSFSILDDSSESELIPTSTKCPETSRLLTELELRGFDRSKMQFLSKERVRRLIFGKLPFYSLSNEKDRMKKEEDFKMQDDIIAKVEQDLGVSFQKTDEGDMLGKVVGARMVRPLASDKFGILTLADLETIRISELKGGWHIGKKAIEELTRLTRDGKIKMAT